jgi:hypothetical protein
MPSNSLMSIEPKMAVDTSRATFTEENWPPARAAIIAVMQ